MQPQDRNEALMLFGCILGIIAILIWLHFVAPDGL